MTATTENWRGRTALMVAHCAGMVDLVALPVWVGTLIAHYGFDPQQAGALATMFLAGAVASSLFFAPRLPRMNRRLAATAGFALAGLAFLAAAGTRDYKLLAVLHLAAGVAAACGLSMTHGTIGRSARPHQLFALVGLALGVFAVLFLGGSMKLIAQTGGPTLFILFGGIMLAAAGVCAAAFPAAAPAHAAQARAGVQPPLGRAVWLAALGISAMTVIQAMIFSFVERIGVDRGFGVNAVTAVLITLSFVNLIPAPLAAWLERRVPARNVVLAGPVVQAVLALLITQTSGFAPYAAATVFFVSVMIFTHTFAFGMIAALDPTGRALAATPAMVMVGSAVGPVLGGTLVKSFGYGSLGLAAVVIAVLGCGALMGRRWGQPVIVQNRRAGRASLALT